MSEQVMKADLPFSSIVGMDSAKKALVCSAVDDDIKGVIIRGPSGTAKSVLVRAFSHLVPDKVMVEVPQNISDEQLFGGLDLETAMTVVRRGYLAEIPSLSRITSPDITHSIRFAITLSSKRFTLSMYSILRSAL